MVTITGTSGEFVGRLQIDTLGRGDLLDQYGKKMGYCTGTKNVFDVGTINLFLSDGTYLGKVERHLGTRGQSDAVHIEGRIKGTTGSLFKMDTFLDQYIPVNDVNDSKLISYLFGSQYRMSQQKNESPQNTLFRTNPVNSAVPATGFQISLRLFFPILVITWLILLLQPIHWFILNHQRTVLMLFGLLPFGMGLIVLLTCLLGGNRDRNFRVMGVVEAIVTIVLTYIFNLCVFSAGGSFLYVGGLLEFGERLEFIKPDFLRFILGLLLLLASYLLFFLPILLIGIIFQKITKRSQLNGMVSMDGANYILYMLIRLICFAALMTGFVLLDPYIRHTLFTMGDGWAALLAFILYLPTEWVAMKISY